jgi:hypothetical protein
MSIFSKIRYSKKLNHLFQQPITNIFLAENKKLHILKHAAARSAFFLHRFPERQITKSFQKNYFQINPRCDALKG